MLKKMPVLLVLVAVACLAPCPAVADAQCGDGWYGAGDPRVPLTLCTPWPKPTYEEWLAGWHVMPPGWHMKSLPVRLTATPGKTSSGYSLEVCYLDVPEDPTHPFYAGRCIGSAVRSVRLDYWCERIRALETGTVRAPWAEIAVCGQTIAAAFRETYRRGKLVGVRRVS